MKKTETRFYCDDCGKPMPAGFVSGEGVNAEYRTKDYNMIRRMQNTDAGITIHTSLLVRMDYRKDLTDLCPECRVKWLKVALGEYERQAQLYAEEQENDEG